MKGKLNLRINRRVITQSRNYWDKYRRVDRLVIWSIIDKDGKKRFHISSFNNNFQPFIISRDELAFVKVLFYYYKDGDYYIQCWAKGKGRGFRTFWDGVITTDKRFFRRRSNPLSLNPTIKHKISLAKYNKDYIGRYMKTKRPGKWHNF